MLKSSPLLAASIAAMMLMGCATRGGGGGSAGGGGMHPMTAKPDMAPCRTNNDCRVPAYVSVGPNDECLVQMLVETVTIAQGKQPMVVWRLEKADPDGDNHDYQFDPTAGVTIIGNDPAKDFDNPGYMGSNHRKFMWKSKNLRRIGFDYSMKVQRRANPSDPWSDCRLLDPKIVNDGP